MNLAQMTPNVIVMMKMIMFIWDWKVYFLYSNNVSAEKKKSSKGWIFAEKPGVLNVRTNLFIGMHDLLEQTVTVIA